MIRQKDRHMHRRFPSSPQAPLISPAFHHTFSSRKNCSKKKNASRYCSPEAFFFRFAARWFSDPNGQHIQTEEVLILDRFRDLINDADTGVFQNVIGIGQGFSFPRVKRYTIVPNAQNCFPAPMLQRRLSARTETALSPDRTRRYFRPNTQRKAASHFDNTFSLCRWTAA